MYFHVFFTDPLNIKPHLNATLNTTSIFDIVSKVAVGAILLLISLPYWIYHCLAGNTIQCKSLKCFPLREPLVFAVHNVYIGQ